MWHGVVAITYRAQPRRRDASSHNVYLVFQLILIGVVNILISTMPTNRFLDAVYLQFLSAVEELPLKIFDFNKPHGRGNCT